MARNWGDEIPGTSIVDLTSVAPAFPLGLIDDALLWITVTVHFTRNAALGICRGD